MRYYEIYISLYFSLFLTFCIYFLYYISINPTVLLIPYNNLIENTYEKKVFYNHEEKNKIFPTSKILESNWENIKMECLSLLSQKNGQYAPKMNIGEKFINEDKKFWEGWNTIELLSFGKKNANLDLCPHLEKILLGDENITTAFFSILKPGKRIPSHYGPFKGILRYHLGLMIPKKEHGDCFISVDDEIYEWENGTGILFDESYKHFVHNDTNYYRIILFLDVKRPMKTVYMKYLNDFILFLMKISPYNF